MTLKEYVARVIFGQEHPRSSWQLHPNYKQQVAQDYRIKCASVLINKINMLTGANLDPDAEYSNLWKGSRDE